MVVGESMSSASNNIIFFIFLFSLFSFSLIPINAETVVVASDQDATLAYQLSNHLNSSIIIIPWGSTDIKYLNDIKSLNPDEVIIIGGNAAVPEIYNYGNYKRYAGKNRAETSYMVLLDFYNISTSSELIYYPSKDAILEFIQEKRNWEVEGGNSNISIRWSKFVEAELRKNCMDNEDHEDNKIYVYVGNLNNNPKMKKSWNKTNIPEILTFCPAVVLSNDTLFITGSDENLPIAVGRLFSGQNSMDIYCFSNNFFKFIILLGITIGVGLYLIRDKYYLLGVLIAILWIINSIDRFNIVWDALLVYLDGALSLLYLGHYETIINDRSFSGLSYILCAWFSIFKPSLESITFYQIYVFFILIGTIFLYFKRKILALVCLLILMSSPIFTKYVLMFSTELTFITFLAIILYFLKELDNKLNKKYINKYILLISLITAISSLVRIHSLIVPLLYLIVKRDKTATYYLLFSIALCGLFLTLTSSHIFGYVNEVSTKGGITLNLIKDNILFYLPKFVKLSAIPIIIIMYELWKKMKFIVNRKMCAISNQNINSINCNFINELVAMTHLIIHYIRCSTIYYSKFTLMLAIVFLIMPMLWVAQDERYLLPSMFLFTIACLEPWDFKTEK
jgi:hypothetical protein